MNGYSGHLGKPDLANVSVPTSSNVQLRLQNGPLLRRPGRPLLGSRNLATNAVNWALADRLLSQLCLACVAQVLSFATSF